MLKLLLRLWRRRGLRWSLGTVLAGWSIEFNTLYNKGFDNRDFRRGNEVDVLRDADRCKVFP